MHGYTDAGARIEFPIVFVQRPMGAVAPNTVKFWVGAADYDNQSLPVDFLLDSWVTLTMRVNGAGDLHFSATGTGNLTIRGTADQINAALAGLMFHAGPTAQSRGAITVVTTNSSGLSETDTIALIITVSAANPVAVPVLNGLGLAMMVVLLGLLGIWKSRRRAYKVEVRDQPGEQESRGPPKRATPLRGAAGWACYKSTWGHNCPVKRIKIGLKWPFRVILVMCVTN